MPEPDGLLLLLEPDEEISLVVVTLELRSWQPTLADTLY